MGGREGGMGGREGKDTDRCNEGRQKWKGKKWRTKQMSDVHVQRRRAE